VFEKLVGPSLQQALLQSHTAILSSLTLLFIIASSAPDAMLDIPVTHTLPAYCGAADLQLVLSVQKHLQ